MLTSAPRVLPMGDGLASWSGSVRCLGWGRGGVTHIARARALLLSVAPKQQQERLHSPCRDDALAHRAPSPLAPPATPPRRLPWPFPPTRSSTASSSVSDP